MESVVVDVVVKLLNVILFIMLMVLLGVSVIGAIAMDVLQAQHSFLP